MSKGNSSNNGVGMYGLTFIALLVLKLTNVIDWSWWWITCPLWGGAAISFIIAIILIIVAIKKGAKKRETLNDRINKIINQNKK